MGLLREWLLNEVADGQPSRADTCEFLQAQEYSALTNLGCIAYLDDGTAKVIHPSSDDESRTTNSGGFATGNDPVAVHSLQNSYGIVPDLLGSMIESKADREDSDDILRVQRCKGTVLDDYLTGAGPVVFSVKLLEKLFEDTAKDEDVGIDGISNVNKHDTGELGVANGVVKTSSSDSIDGATSDPPLVLNFAECVESDFLDLLGNSLSTALQSNGGKDKLALLKGLCIVPAATIACNLPVTDGHGHARTGFVEADVDTGHISSTTSCLAEADLVDNVGVLVHDRTTVDTDSLRTDSGAGTSGISALPDGSSGWWTAPNGGGSDGAVPVGRNYGAGSGGGLAGGTLGPDKGAILNLPGRVRALLHRRCHGGFRGPGLIE